MHSNGSFCSIITLAVAIDALPERHNYTRNSLPRHSAVGDERFGKMHETFVELFCTHSELKHNTNAVK